MPNMSKYVSTRLRLLTKLKLPKHLTTSSQQVTCQQQTNEHTASPDVTISKYDDSVFSFYYLLFYYLFYYCYCFYFNLIVNEANK